MYDESRHIPFSQILFITLQTPSLHLKSEFLDRDQPYAKLSLNSKFLIWNSFGLVVFNSSSLLSLLPLSSIGKSCRVGGGLTNKIPGAGVFAWHLSRCGTLDAENSFFFVSHLSLMQLIITSTHLSFLHWQVRRVNDDSAEWWLVDSDKIWYNY